MKELPVGDWGKRGTWHGKTCHTRLSATLKVIVVCCPICGSDSTLSGHTISDDGIVAPVFYCPYGCGCRVTLKLVGYDEFLKTCQAEEPPGPDPHLETGPESNFS